MLSFLLVELLFVILGIVFLCGKGSFLIAGYNTMIPQEKAQWNEKALCQTTGLLVLIIAACVAVAVLSAMLHNYILLTISILLLFVVAICGAIYVNTSKKLKRK